MELTFHMICPFLVQLNNNWNKEMLKYFLVQNKSKYNYKKSILWGTVISLVVTHPNLSKKAQLLQLDCKIFLVKMIFHLDDNKNSYHRPSTWSSSEKSETRWTGQDRANKEL